MARASMADLISRRRRVRFVGRRGERAAFQENFTFPPEDDRHRFLFHVHGHAGVGKTFLVREMEQLARERGALTAYVDEGVGSVPEALAAISVQCAQQGHPLKALDKLLATYRQRRHEAESATVPDAAAEGEGPSTGSMVAARAGLAGIGLVPVVGAFAGALDPAELAQGADRLRTVLSARFRNQEDVQLVLAPDRVLTPVFASELDGMDVPWIVLFFDTYERTSPFLDGWLRDLMVTERYGPLPAHVVVVLAGQRPFDAARWGGGLPEFVADLPLEPFSESETRDFLATKGVTDESVVAEVLRLSGGLPVLVSTLAENQPADRADVGDPSTTAVERFLKWEQDPKRRTAALACAVPRRLDEDVFRAAADTPPDETGALYGWLCGLPFVRDRGRGADGGGGVQYHDVVRAPMLRLQRHRSRRDLAARHARLAETFGRWREEAAEGLDPDDVWEHEPWREQRLEETYHLLCARPVAALPGALADVVAACRVGAVVGRRWARMLSDAGEDTDTEAVRKWGRGLTGALADDGDGVAGALDLLLARPGLDVAGRAEAHAVRGREWRNAGEFTRAVAEYGRALALDPELVRAHYGLGVTRQLLGDYDAALADLGRADMLAPDTSWIVYELGETCRVAGRFDDAVRYFERAGALDPTNAGIWASRGVCHYGLGDLDAALMDLDRSLGLQDDYLWALVRRARLRQARGETDQAFADLDRAVALAPDSVWIASERGDLYRLADRHEDAVTELTRAITLDPDHASSYAGRGMVLTALERYDEARSDLDRAVELDPSYVWALIRRAHLHRELGDKESMLGDLDRAVTAAPDRAWARAQRADGLRIAGRYEEAITDAGRAVELDPAYAWPLAIRGAVHMLTGDRLAAVADLDRAIDLSPDYGHARLKRAVALLALGRIDRAKADLRMPDVAMNYPARALTLLTEQLLREGRGEEAQSLLDAAGPEAGAHLDALRAQAHRLAGRWDAARQCALRLRAHDPVLGTFELALTVGLIEGRAAAAPLWRHLARLTEETGNEAPKLLLPRAVVHYALGDWPRADVLLADALAGPCNWDALADMVLVLTQLQAAPSPDAHLLAPRLARVAAARDALQERFA
ncbi:tetratricopeptide repeat protein [Streptomyces sp. NPDC058001]|uniref:tetratricopeptide repeat protein n=1 Tax=Streptomyces sp. NPDC058001 TaxID=3346300 RepID=UPI0036EE2504